MIILDLNQNIISNIMAQVGTHTNVPIEINLVRHMVLNQIRVFRNKYRSEFGNDFVIASDGRHYWRRDVFPYYKAARAKARKDSDFDWQSLFDCMNTIREELVEYMPYPVVYHDKAEADDVIGTLVHAKGVYLNNEHTEKILILSGDGDFAQLQKFSNVQQYDPVRGKSIVTNDASKYLREHIIRGDTGDGVPNILSPDDTFVNKIRQKKITQKVIEEWINLDEENVKDTKYRRNRELIDLTQTPEWLRNEITEIYKSQLNKPRDRMFNYFVNARLKLLLQHLQEF